MLQLCCVVSIAVCYRRDHKLTTLTIYYASGAERCTSSEVPAKINF